jgi:hypothetical protein
MGKIEHGTRVTCIKDSLRDIDGYIATAERERITYQEGATDREVLDESVLELLLMASGNGRLS